VARGEVAFIPSIQPWQTTPKLTSPLAGIGKGITSHYLLQPNTTVIAGIRDLEGSSAAGLKSLKLAEGSNIILVKLDSVSREDARNAVRIVQGKHNIDHIDVVIANAGICDHLLPVAEIEIDELGRHIDTNVYGVLRLFQATWPMLQKSALPKFACVSSRLGSISYSVTDQGTTGSYGLSKAAANYLIAKIAAENVSLIAFTIDPG
jgi:norsolorinic acid ketoreductase